MSKRFRVKDYAKIRKNAPKIYQIKGKVTLKPNNINENQIQLVGWRRGEEYGCRRYEHGEYRHNHLPNLYGPSLRQRLYAYAIAGTLVTVSLDDFTFVGRVISVDGDDFEMTVAHPRNSHFARGSLVTVNIRRVQAIATGGHCEE